jgi:hypothetical protein
MRTTMPMFLLLSACSPPPFSELIDAGVADYLGEATISEQSSADGVDTVVFDPASGPICLRGEPFSVSVREQKPSKELMIFLQGGGACWSDFCLAVEQTTGSIPTALEALDQTLDYNPFRDMSLVYVPYCDGSLFSGDAEFDDDGDGESDRLQYGLRNLSATLDVTRERFPSPERIVLAGSSGGAYGSVLAAVLVRHVYPDVPIDVVSDSGSGVARGETEPAFVTDLVNEWNARRFVPESCPDCLADGHLTGFIAWQLDEDPDLRMALFSSYRDSVISSVFLSLDPEVFETDLRRETSDLSKAFPDRYAPFLIEGDAHTTLLGDVSGFLGEDFELADAIGDMVSLSGMQTSVVDDVDFATWIGWMLDRDPRWGDRRQ